MQKPDEQTEWVCLEQESAEDAPKKKHRRWPAVLAAAAVVCSLSYSILAFSHIPFIEKWRTIYIETAMGTMTHQWLATAFFPQSLIDEVMNSRITLEIQQEEIISHWEDTGPKKEPDTIVVWEQLESSFFDGYPEIDADSMRQYMQTADEQQIFDADGYLMIDAADVDAPPTGIRTIYGDPVCAVDTRNGIVIVALEGSGYQGRMAMVKNPGQVRLAASRTLGTSGSYIDELCEQNHAVLGINASGFSDPKGTGNGGNVFGLVYANGLPVRNILDTSMKVISLDRENRLNITNTLPQDARDAMQFGPALVVNGEALISGSSGWGLQPRAVMGQTADGTILLAVVDGRQPGHSIGITLGDLTDILYRYGAYQAGNLDGGSSAILYYNGRTITRSSSVTPEQGRHIPNAWIVKENP